MATDMTIEESRLLSDADNDFFNMGETNIKCPRCGGDIITTDYGTSYTISCVNDCITAVCRGI